MSRNSPVLSRAKQMDALRSEAAQRGVQVMGEGNVNAALMLVGEAPGKEESAAGRPFVGPAGVVLDRILERAGIPRDDIWITNLVKVRPTVTIAGRIANRPPRSEEIGSYRDVLDDEIRIIRPRVILCLGTIAASSLIHPGFRVAQERGRWFAGPFNTRVMATYHPAYLLRRRGADYEATRDAMLADFLRAWAEARQLPGSK